MIPMRDGVKLFVCIYEPKDKKQKYPIMFDRTPYSVGPYGPDNYKTSLGPDELFAREGYVFVYGDVRGRYLSQGEYEDVRPYLPNKKGRRTPTTRLIGSSRTSRTTMAASASMEFLILVSTPRWPASMVIRQSRPSRRRRPSPIGFTATIIITTARCSCRRIFRSSRDLASRGPCPHRTMITSNLLITAPRTASSFITTSAG